MVVAMHVKVDGEEQVIMLNAGDIFYAGVGCEHVAHPQRRHTYSGD